MTPTAPPIFTPLAPAPVDVPAAPVTLADADAALELSPPTLAETDETALLVAEASAAEMVAGAPPVDWAAPVAVAEADSWASVAVAEADSSAPVDSAAGEEPEAEAEEEPSVKLGTVTPAAVQTWVSSRASRWNQKEGSNGKLEVSSGRWERQTRRVCHHAWAEKEGDERSIVPWRAATLSAPIASMHDLTAEKVSSLHTHDATHTQGQREGQGGTVSFQLVLPPIVASSFPSAQERGLTGLGLLGGRVVSETLGRDVARGRASGSDVLAGREGEPPRERGGDGCGEGGEGESEEEERGGEHLERETKEGMW